MPKMLNEVDLFLENADMSNVKDGQNPSGRKLKVFSVKLRYVRVNWFLTKFFWDGYDQTGNYITILITDAGQLECKTF